MNTASEHESSQRRPSGHYEERLSWLAGAMFAVAGAVFLALWLWERSSEYQIVTGLLLLAAGAVWMVLAVVSRRRRQGDPHRGN